MARFIKTISADGSSGGSGAGVSLQDVCTAVCKVISANAQCTTNGVTQSMDQRQIVPGYSEWEIICNCSCWTDCYGCSIIWCLPTAKPYNAYRFHYTGIMFCPCCYMYMCWGLGTDNCFCCCNNSYCLLCMCGWPGYSCCQWSNRNCCHLSQNGCWYCCNSPYGNIVDMAWTICQSKTMGSYRERGWSIDYDFCFRKRPQETSNTNHWTPSVNRWWGSLGECQCMYWGCEQNTNPNRIFTRICLNVSDQPWQSSLASAFQTWQSSNGGNLMTGVPCWTIYGRNCYKPDMGTLSGNMV